MCVRAHARLCDSAFTPVFIAASTKHFYFQPDLQPSPICHITHGFQLVSAARCHRPTDRPRDDRGGGSEQGSVSVPSKKNCSFWCFALSVSEGQTVSVCCDPPSGPVSRRVRAHLVAPGGRWGGSAAHFLSHGRLRGGGGGGGADVTAAKDRSGSYLPCVAGGWALTQQRNVFICSTLRGNPAVACLGEGTQVTCGKRHLGF